MTGSGSGVGGATPSLEGAEPEQYVPVDEGDRQFGRYHLRYEIASGGMATVYLARAKGPAGFDRAVALKRIHPHLAKKKEFVEMFLDEARLGARITHPNVCSVFDFGEVGGTYFMAMEYLAGQPVSALLRAVSARPPLVVSPQWRAYAARIIADACEGLHAAHELVDERGKKLGVIHRDCTPHNIFVTYDGAVKVVDFGVAFAEGRLHQTQTGALKGKLGYMSPEQVRGKDIDRRLDVWALGVCLWELLAVKRLFGKRQEVELIQAVASEPILPPSSVRPGIPPELDRIVMKALERDVDKRYPTTRAMARDLNAFISASGVAAGLADLSELVEELFAKERETKLGVVASVLQTGSDALVVGTKSGQRIVDAPTLASPEMAPTQAAADVPATQVHPSAASSSGLVPAPLARDSTAETELPRAGVPMWVWAATVGGAVLVALAGIGYGVMSRSGAPEAVAVSLATPPSTSPPAPPAATTATPPSTPTATPTSTPPATGTPPSTAATTTPPPSTPPSTPTATATTPPPSTAIATTPSPDPPAADPAPADPPPATHARTGPGTIAVSATGAWADIFIDGTPSGRTPRQLRVPAGRHDVELRPNGTSPGRHQTVTVRPGATSRVTMSF